MRKGDEVFFLTLVDFLLQVCFFGLFVFVAYYANETRVQAMEKSNAAATALERLKNHFGVSNLVELTDYLTQLVPANQLPGWSEFYSKGTTPEEAKRAVDLVRRHGGV